MFDYVFNIEEEMDTREKAADNMIVLAKERASAELLFQEGVVPRIAKLMKVEKNAKIRLSLIRVFGDLGKSEMARAREIVKEAGIPFFLDALNTSDEETVTAVAYVIQSLLDSLSQIELTQKWEERVKGGKVSKSYI